MLTLIFVFKCDFLRFWNDLGPILDRFWASEPLNISILPRSNHYFWGFRKKRLFATVMCFGFKKPYFGVTFRRPWEAWNSKHCPWGPPKMHKKAPRCPKSGFWDVFWTRLFSKAGFGRVLNGFWEEFGWILRVADRIVDSYFAPCWDKLWLGRPRKGQWRSTNQILR